MEKDLLAHLSRKGTEGELPPLFHPLMEDAGLTAAEEFVPPTLGDRRPAARRSGGMGLRPLRIGLIGYGTIGRRVAEAVRGGRAGAAAVVVALVRDPARVADSGGIPLTADPEAFFAADTGVVVEAAGQAALRQYLRAALAAGKHVVTVSSGALADPEFLADARRWAEEAGRRVLVPSGAIAGLDAVGAAAMGGIDAVTHTVRKPLAAFTREQLPGESRAGPVTLFEGSVLDGARLFPENVNVAASLVLSGAPPERTTLRVVADPWVERNTHEIDVRGWFGRLRLTMENVPTENPKTGRIVALSVAKALRFLTEPVVAGF